MLLSRLTQELNDPGLAVMDHQARFQIYGPSPALRKFETKELVIPMEFSSFEDLWRIQSNAQGPVKPYISSLSEDRRQVLKERLRGEIFGTRPDGPFMLQAKAWAVKGTVPRD
jgi:hypothetical protein